MPGFRQGHLSGPKGLRDFIGPDPQTAIADKSDALWLVVQKYEQKELADDSEDEKRIKKAQEKACRRERQLASEDRSFFKVMCGFNCRFALSLLFLALVLPERSYPTCICSGCLLSLFSLRCPN